MIASRFTLAVKKYGLNQTRRPADLSQFKVPDKAGDQLTLF